MPRALVSVSDKRGVVDFARGLAALGFEILSTPAAHFTMVRPGIMLYGYAPAAHLASRAPLAPAMRLRTRVAQTRRIVAGTPVGYAGTWVAARPSTIAVLPLGYADGYHRLASNRAQVLVHGRRAPLAGRVCMDQKIGRAHV